MELPTPPESTPSASTPSISTPSASQQRNIRWVPEMESALIETLVDQVRQGKRSENGYKKEAWTAAIAAVRTVSARQNITLSACKTKLDYHKSIWKKWQALAGDSSGFDFDPVTRLYTASEEVWQNYIKAHPKAKKFPRSKLEYLDLLDELFSGTVATGDYRRFLRETRRPESEPEGDSFDSPIALEGREGDRSSCATSVQLVRSRKRVKTASAGEGLSLLSESLNNSNRLREAREARVAEKSSMNIRLSPRLVVNRYQEKLSPDDLTTAIQAVAV